MSSSDGAKIAWIAENQRVVINDVVSGEVSAHPSETRDASATSFAFRPNCPIVASADGTGCIS